DSKSSGVTPRAGSTPASGTRLESVLHPEETMVLFGVYRFRRSTDPVHGRKLPVEADGAEDPAAETQRGARLLHLPPPVGEHDHPAPRNQHPLGLGQKLRVKAR